MGRFYYFFRYCFYLHQLYVLLYLNGSSAPIDNFISGLITSNVALWAIIVVTTLNSFIFGAIAVSKIAMQVIHFEWSQTIDYPNTQNFEKTKVLTCDDINEPFSNSKLCVYESAKQPGFYRTVVITLRETIPFACFKDPQYRLTQNLIIKSDLVHKAFQTLKVPQHITFDRFQVIGPHITMHTKTVMTKVELLKIVDELLLSIYVEHLRPFKVLPPAKLPEYKTVTVETLSVGCPFGVIQTLHPINPAEFAIKIGLPQVLSMQFYQTVKIPGFNPQEELLNKALLQKAVSSNTYRINNHWRGALVDDDKNVQVILPQPELTVARLHEWVDIFKKQLIEHSPSVLLAREKNNVLSEINRLVQQRPPLLTKINSIHAAIKQHGSPPPSEDKIPRDYFDKFNSVKKCVDQFTYKMKPIQADGTLQLSTLKEIRANLLAEVEKLNAQLDQVTAGESALLQAEKKYINYLAAQNKKVKPTEVVLEITPVVVKKPEIKMAAPVVTTPEVRPTNSSSTSSSSTSKVPEYDPESFPDKILQGSKKSIHFFEQQHEVALTAEKNALFVYTNSIINKMTLPIDPALRRKTIYQLIDQFAILNLALQEMVKQQIISNKGIALITRTCRDTLRHFADQFIQSNAQTTLYSELRIIVSNLKNNLDREVRSPLFLAEKTGLENLMNLISQQTDETTRTQCFLSDLEFITQSTPDENLDYYAGYLTQLGNHLHAFKEHSNEFFQSLLNSRSHIKMLSIDDFRSMTLDDMQQSLQNLHPGNLLYLCLQIRNIRGHELDTDMIFPLYQISQNSVNVDSISDDVKIAVFFAVHRNAEQIREHVHFVLQATDQAVVFGCSDDYADQEHIGAMTTAPLNSRGLNPNAYNKVVEVTWTAQTVHQIDPDPLLQSMQFK